MAETLRAPGCGAALAAGAPPELVRTVVQGMGMPLWFLAACLACQALLPLTAGRYGRAPRATVAGLLAAVVAVDALRIATGARVVSLPGESTGVRTEGRLAARAPDRGTVAPGETGGMDAAHAGDGVDPHSPCGSAG